MNSEEQTNTPENVTGIPAPASGEGDGANAVSWAVTETSTMANTIKKRALQMLMLAISKENEL